MESGWHAVVTGEENGDIKLWDVATAKQMKAVARQGRLGAVARLEQGGDAACLWTLKRNHHDLEHGRLAVSSRP